MGREISQTDVFTKPAIFPGYYTGRATHVHAKVFPEWTTHPNGSYTGDRLVHVGQFFFEDEMNLVVDKVSYGYSGKIGKKPSGV